MKLAAIIVGLLFLLTAPTDNRQDNGSPDSTKQRIYINEYDADFEKIITNLRRRNTDNVSLVGTRKYRKGFRGALISVDTVKKAGRYQEVYDTLSLYFDEAPSSLVYYDELISSGAASGNLLLIKNKLDDINGRMLSPFEKYAKAIILNLRGNIDSSITMFDIVVKESHLLAPVYLKYANALKDKGRYNEALEVLNQFNKSNYGDAYLQVDAIIIRGNISFLKGKYDEAQRYYNTAKKMAFNLYDLYTTAKANINSGLVYDIYSDFEKARQLIELGISTAIELKDPELLAYAYSEMGVSYSFTSEYPEALSYYNEALVIYRKMGNTLRMSYLNANKGNLQNSLGNYAGAIASYTDGIEAGGDAPRPIIQNLTGLADVYSNTGNYAQALKLYNEAAQLALKIEDADLLSSVESGLGAFKLNMGAYPAAEVNFTNALRYNAGLKNQLQQIETEDKLALALAGQGKTDSAITLLKKVTRQAARLGDIYLKIVASLHLAEIMHVYGDQTAALAIHAGIQKDLKSPGFENLKLESALAESKIRLNSGDAAGAKGILQQYETEIKQNPNIFLQIYFFATSARTEKKIGNRRLALKLFKEAILLTEHVGKSLTLHDDLVTSFAKSAESIYTDAINVSLELSDYKGVFELIERQNGRSTFRNVTSIQMAQKLNDVSLLDEIYALEWEIESGLYTGTQLDSLKKSLNVLTEKYQLSELIIPQSYTLKEMQSALGKNEYIFSVYTTEDSTYIFLVSNLEFKVRKLKGGKTSLTRIKKAVSPYYDKMPGTPNFVNKDLFAFDAIASKYLYNYLFGNLADEIEAGSQIIVLPGKELRDFPLEILVTETEDKTDSYNYDECNFAAERYRFVYTPSFSTFKSLEKYRVQKNSHSLLVGNPQVALQSNTFTERRSLFIGMQPGKPVRAKFLPLKYSLKEVNQIDNMLDFATVLSGSFATESRFKELAGSASLIHLSTHSAVYLDKPVIFFSNLYDAENDGFLEVGEIASLGLQSDLVVLSSCSSGLGDPEAAEGVTGMNKAMLEGGAKSVISTLWEINDEYTARFMVMFYDHLSVGISKSEALRRTRTDFINKVNADPYYWGAFVLYGADTPMSVEKKNYLFIAFQYLSLTFVGLFILAIYLRRLTRKKITPL